MFRVSRQIDFCYGHRLLNYLGKCRFLHGHNGRVIITLEAPALDERGMVMDFSEIKRSVSQWIDETLDHRMILHRDDPVVPLLEQMGEPMFLLDVNPTAENIAKLIFDFSGATRFSHRRGPTMGDSAMLRDLHRSRWGALTVRRASCARKMRRVRRAFLGRTPDSHSPLGCCRWRCKQ